MLQITLDRTGRGRLIDIPGGENCAIEGCTQKAIHSAFITAEAINLSAIRMGADNWGGAGTRGSLCDHHLKMMSEVVADKIVILDGPFESRNVARDWLDAQSDDYAPQTPNPKVVRGFDDKWYICDCQENDLYSLKVQEWINSIGDTDMPLEEAKRINREAAPGEATTKASKNVVRAERRLCALYAPKYVKALLSGDKKANLRTTGELEAFEEARKRGE